MRVRLARLLICSVFILTACGTAPGTPAASTPAEQLRIETKPAAGSNGAPDSTPTLQAETPGDDSSTEPSEGAYDIGQPVLTDLFVSPNGSDSNDGRSAEAPLRTLSAAWALIPTDRPLTGSGWRISLLPGEYPCEPGEPDNCQNFFSSRWGSAEAPIWITAAEGPGTVTVRGGLDLLDIAYLYLTDLTLAGGVPLPTNVSGNNLLHLSIVDHVLLRGMVLDGPDCANDSCNNLQEVLKVNQAQHLYVESSTISGAWHSAVDYFSVQYGHFRANRVQTAGQWCMYIKGGSAYLRVEGNEFGPCQLGFQAGQSSNLAVMRTPWVHYEAYGVQVVNNVFHDLPGVALSVSGGYNVLMAHNTLVRVGTSADPGYPLAQLVHGERGCNATDELPDPLATCQSVIEQGGWGPNVLTENLPAIPNHNIFIFNNLVWNPAPAQTQYSHLYAAAPVELPNGFQNLPGMVPADENVLIAGNVIWNGPLEHPLGLEEGTGCPPGHQTCSAGQVLAENLINTLEPQWLNAAGEDYHPLPGSLSADMGRSIPDFTWEDFSPAVPIWTVSNQILQDMDGLPREGNLPGAYTILR